MPHILQVCTKDRPDGSQSEWQMHSDTRHAALAGRTAASERELLPRAMHTQSTTRQDIDKGEIQARQQ